MVKLELENIHSMNKLKREQFRQQIRRSSHEKEFSKKRSMSKIEINDLYVYYPHKQLGSGTFAEVYEGHCISNKTKPLAVKIIYDNDINVQKELAALSMLNGCPHVLELVDYYRNDNVHYLITELCDNTLAELYPIENKTSALKYFQELLIAFDKLHQNNILHRDIKLTNIFIKNDQIKLADFGLALLINPRTSNRSGQCGSLTTISPELYRAVDGFDYTDKQDVWSLGVILHLIFFQQHPFNNSIDRLCINDRCPIADDEDPLVVSLVNSMLEFNIEDRMSMKELLSHPIRSIKYTDYADSESTQ